MTFKNISSERKGAFVTDEMKDIVKALRICGNLGVDICDGKQPNAIDICKDCPFFEHLKAGKHRKCFKMWIKAADEIERLTKIAEESSMKAALCDEVMEICAKQQKELAAAKSNAQNTHVSQSARQEWISVADRMPAERDSLLARWYGTQRWDNSMWCKQSETVIICRRYPDGSQIVMTDMTYDGRWFESKLNICSGQVTHWMPMPEPPKMD